MAEDIGTKKSVALKGHKYVVDTTGVSRSHRLVIDTAGVTKSHTLVITTGSGTNGHRTDITTGGLYSYYHQQRQELDSCRATYYYTYVAIAQY